MRTAHSSQHQENLQCLQCVLLRFSLWVLLCDPLLLAQLPSHPHIAGKPSFFLLVHWRKKKFKWLWKEIQVCFVEWVLTGTAVLGLSKGLWQLLVPHCLLPLPSHPLENGWKILARTLEGGAPWADVATSELLRNPQSGGSASFSLTWGFMNFNEQ